MNRTIPPSNISLFILVTEKTHLLIFYHVLQARTIFQNIFIGKINDLFPWAASLFLFLFSRN